MPGARQNSELVVGERVHDAQPLELAQRLQHLVGVGPDAGRGHARQHDALPSCPAAPGRRSRARTRRTAGLGRWSNANSLALRGGVAVPGLEQAHHELAVVRAEEVHRVGVQLLAPRSARRSRRGCAGPAPGSAGTRAGCPRRSRGRCCPGCWRGRARRSCRRPAGPCCPAAAGAPRRSGSAARPSCGGSGRRRRRSSSPCPAGPSRRRASRPRGTGSRGMPVMRSTISGVYRL